MDLVVVVDDTGTMSACSQGWAYFTIPDSKREVFVARATEIIETSKLAGFHGKDFKRRFAKSYVQFLTIVREMLATECGSSLIVTLLNETWKTDYLQFCNRVISNAFVNAGIANDALTNASVALASSLFTFQRLAPGVATDRLTLFEIDSHSITEVLPGLELVIGGHSINPTTPIYACYNSYRNERFPRSPQLVKGSMKVLKDEDSFLIQAADLFANFSTAYAFQKLGKDSNTNNQKAGIFLDCFGDLIPDFDFQSNVSIIGDDLVLKENGAWTLCVNSNRSTSASSI
jgi:hypothetical protein